MAMLQAHRGVSTEYPENTMTAYLAAIEQGYEYIEIDPEVTKDGVPVLLHDANIGRTARNADGSIIENAPRISDIIWSYLSWKYGLCRESSGLSAKDRRFDLWRWQERV